MENEFNEYVTFTITTKDGEEVEMAVVDEFDFEDKHYVVGALIKDARGYHALLTWPVMQ